jgi:hypothetical protein
MSIFSEILIIIKFGEKLRNIYNVQPLDCPNPRLASWTNFNARRLRMYFSRILIWRPIAELGLEVSVVWGKAYHTWGGFT